MTFAQAPPDKSANVSGIVVSSTTGAPVPRAHVALALESGEDRSYGAMTTGDGRFSITGIRPGSYALTLERIGFTMPTDAHAPENLPVVFAAGESRTDLKLQLVPAGAIAGRVTNADGQPVQGVIVSAESSGGVFDGSGTSTDAHGSFRISGLAPGHYRVRAVPENPHTPPEARTDGTVDVQDAPTYYPGSLTFRQGTRVAVAPGAETNGVAIQLARVPIVSVSGKVEGITEGGFNAQLFIAEPGGGGRSSAGVKPDGAFRLWRLFPGKYQINAMWQAPGGREYQSAPVEVEVAGASIGNVRLRIIPPANLSGHLEFPDDAAKPPPNVSARLTLVDTGIRGGAKVIDSATDGTFRVSGLRAGRYRVIPSWKNAYVASMQLGQATMDGSLLDLTNGSGDAELSIRVKSATGSIMGSVAAGTHVALVFAGDPGGVPPRFETSDPAGHYRFDGVAPGKYKLLALPDADSDYVMQSGRFDDYEDSMQGIEIHADEKVARDLTRSAPADR
jgi:protocatechuate 3,4-dioxygenase beta subunit